MHHETVTVADHQAQVAAATPLPVTDWEFDACKQTTRPIPGRPSSPAVVRVEPTPGRTDKTNLRRATPVRFVDNTDSVIVRREGKPDLRITVTEENKTPPGITRPGRSGRVHTMDLSKLGGFGLEIAVGGQTENLRIALEIAR